MRYATLGGGGAVVSSLALGTMTFGAESDEDTSNQMMTMFVEAGGTLFDTANTYSLGGSEQIVGRWLADHPTEARQAVLATKARYPMGEGTNDLGVSRRHLRMALDDSLRRLGVDHIDLYQTHGWESLTPIAETLRFLDDAVSAGKILYYGFSNYRGWQLTKAVHIASAHGWAAPVALQPQYNLLAREIEHEIVPAALDANLGLLTWSPLAGGWLSGKYRRDVPPTRDTRLGESHQGMEVWADRNANVQTWRVVDAVRLVADARAASPSQVALAWVTARPGVTSVILGARTVRQLTDNMAAADLDLSADELRVLTDASAPIVGDYPYGRIGEVQQKRRITGGH